MCAQSNSGTHEWFISQSGREWHRDDGLGRVWRSNNGTFCGGVIDPDTGTFDLRTSGQATPWDAANIIDSVIPR